MTILKIIETLQIYSEDFIAYKLDGGFANAVTEAVSLLISQGEQIADLQNELRDERYRHDRVQDFEVDEAEELRKAREAQRWIPVTERLPEKHTIVFVYRPKMAIKFMVSYFGVDCFCDGAMDIHGNEVITHWMPMPQPPKEVSHDE